MAKFRVIVCGSGPIAREVVRAVDRVDFGIVWVVPGKGSRPSRRRVGRTAHPLHSDSLAWFRRAKLTETDFVVLATRETNVDLPCLEKVLRSPAGFVGVLGSRSRGAALRAALRVGGIARADLDRVHCPVGLDIGSLTPAEIGLSIAAQLVQERARALFGGTTAKPSPVLAACPSRAPRSRPQRRRGNPR